MPGNAMRAYYAKKLSANHLRQVYALADQAVHDYLQGEIDCVAGLIQGGDQVIEFGCGYGRILKEIASTEHDCIGIDHAIGNIELAQHELANSPRTRVKLMSVEAAAFEQKFDWVLCLQNGLSAFAHSPLTTLISARSLLSHKGRIICATYTDSFWPHRLRWFQRQSDAGLIGDIDTENTGNGVIRCTDGFVSSSMQAEQFEQLAEQLNMSVTIVELPTGSLLAQFSEAHTDTTPGGEDAQAIAL